MMLEMFESRARHPLWELREKASITQAELARATGLSCTKISLAENYLAPLTAVQEEKLKQAVVEITQRRTRAVISEARR